MFLFAITTLLSLVLLVGIHIANVSLWIGAALVVSMHLMTLYGLLYPASSLFCSTVSKCTGATEKVVALTFDDGPCPPITKDVLAILKDRGVRASFFCIGRYVRRHPQVTRTIVEAGHEIGNHSYLHPRHIYLWSKRALTKDTALAQRVLKRATRQRPTLYRPPIGFRNFFMSGITRREHLRVINFSVRSLDTGRSKPDAIVARVLRRIKPGCIILFHDGCDKNAKPDRRATLEALPILIDILKGTGYRFVTVSDLLKNSQSA